MLSWRKDKGESGVDAEGRPAAVHDLLPSAQELGEMLVAAGMINASQFDEALAKAEADDTFIGRVLVESGLVDRKQLTSFIVKECRIPHLSLVDYEVNQDLLELIPKEVCLQHRVLPIDKLGRILTLAMVNPLDGVALGRMRELCPQLKIKPILCDWEDYDLVATRLFAKGGQHAPEISMSSFGLTEAAPVAGASQGQAAAPPVSAPLAEERPLPPATVTAGGSVDSAALVAALRDGLREANRETVAALTTLLAERGTPAAAAPSTEDLATAIESGVTHALQEALGGLAEEIRALRAAPANAAAPPETAPAEVTPSAVDAWASALRDGVKSAISEAMEPLLERLSAPAGAPAADSQALAAALQESLQGTLKELAGVVRAPAAPGAAEPAGGLDTVAADIRASAEAAMEAVRAALSVQQDSFEALASDYASKVKRFNTVQPFRGANGDKALEDALEAIVLPEDERVRQALDASAPLTGFTFDSFQVSKSNGFTVNIAQQIAAKPGADHNPFFVFGPVGIGKTHLVNAMGNAIQKADGKRRVGYASAGRFAGAVTDALHEHATAAFREAYCHWDVLILDDIQFLGGHVAAQEEFFHIFNALQQEGRQIIIAADKAPDQLGQLEQRLVSRFGGGMVSPLDPPDYETRVGILKQLAKQAKAKVPEDVLAVVATRVPRDVRRMTGAMRKIIAFTGLVGQDVTCDTAYEILNRMGVAEAAST